MSATYEVTGFILIKVPIDDMYHCSQSSTPDEIAEIVKDSISNKIGLIENIGHTLKLKRID